MKQRSWHFNRVVAEKGEGLIRQEEDICSGRRRRTEKEKEENILEKEKSLQVEGRKSKAL